MRVQMGSLQMMGSRSFLNNQLRSSVMQVSPHASFATCSRL